MPKVLIHRDAAQDLRDILAAGAIADHGVILAFLQQAKCDHALLETMTEDWFGEDGSAHYTIRKIVSLHRRGKQLWRIKVLTLKGLAIGYRVLYAFDQRQQVFYVLGIPPRDIAYDQTHPRIQRLISVYENLDLT